MTDGERSTGWKKDGAIHMLRQTPFRQSPPPPLIQIEHRIIQKAGDDERTIETHRELFDSAAKADKYWNRTRMNPPLTYRR